MRVTIIGSGDAFGSGGRFNTCFYLNKGASPGLLVDCGASSMIAMRRYEIDPNSIGVILVSHLHGDHFGGLPFFILDAQFYSQRRHPLTIAGPVGLRRRLSEAMEVLFPGSSGTEQRFELRVHEIDPETSLNIDGFTVSAAVVRHECGAPPLALRVESGGTTVAYSGDTEWTDVLVNISRDADLFIVESLSYEKRIPYHLDYRTLLTQSKRITAKRTLLTHLGPEMLAKAAESTFEIAREGSILDI